MNVSWLVSRQLRTAVQRYINIIDHDDPGVWRQRRRSGRRHESQSCLRCLGGGASEERKEERRERAPSILPKERMAWNHEWVV